MLIVGYVFAIRSERRICAEVRVNLAYRWFCKLGIEDKIPDHSVFCRARHERFRESDALRRVFHDGFEIISVFSCLHGQNEGSSNVEKQMNPIGGDAPNCFPRRRAQHSMHCSPNRAPNRALLCLGRPSHPLVLICQLQFLTLCWHNAAPPEALNTRGGSCSFAGRRPDPPAPSRM